MWAKWSCNATNNLALGRQWANQRYDLQESVLAGSTNRLSTFPVNADKSLADSFPGYNRYIEFWGPSLDPLTPYAPILRPWPSSRGRKTWSWGNEGRPRKGFVYSGDEDLLPASTPPHPIPTPTPHTGHQTAMKDIPSHVAPQTQSAFCV